MSSFVLLIAVAGGVFIAFLLLAAVIWGIRMRREEGNFVPAPEKWKKRRHGAAEEADLSGSYQHWLGERTEETAADAGEIPTPEWMREEARDILEAADARTPIGAEAESPMRSMLRKMVPELSTIIDIGKLVRLAEAAGAQSGSAEDHNAALLRVATELAKQQPENDFLRQILASLKIEASTPDSLDPQARIKIVRIPGRNIIHVDGVEYSSILDIPDPQLREEARRILDSQDS